MKEAMQHSASGNLHNDRGSAAKRQWKCSKAAEVAQQAKEAVQHSDGDSAAQSSTAKEARQHSDSGI